MKSCLNQNLLLQLYTNTSFIYIGIYGRHMDALLGGKETSHYVEFVIKHSTVH